MDQLWGLSLSESKVTDAGLRKLRNLPALQTLIIDTIGNSRGMGITNAGIEEIVQKFPDLTSLELDGPGVRSVTDLGMQSIARLKKLVMVRISNASITDEGIAFLGTAQSLTTIGLTGSKVSPASARQLLEATPTLRSVEMNGVKYRK
jgi:hypothetical protein